MGLEIRFGGTHVATVKEECTVLLVLVQDKVIRPSSAAGASPYPHFARELPNGEADYIQISSMLRNTVQHLIPAYSTLPITMSIILDKTALSCAI